MCRCTCSTGQAHVDKLDSAVMPHHTQVPPATRRHHTTAPARSHQLWLEGVLHYSTSLMSLWITPTHPAACLFILQCKVMIQRPCISHHTNYRRNTNQHTTCIPCCSVPSRHNCLCPAGSAARQLARALHCSSNIQGIPTSGQTQCATTRPPTDCK
jgi:hypothetical protein